MTTESLNEFLKISQLARAVVKNKFKIYELYICYLLTDCDYLGHIYSK